MELEENGDGNGATGGKGTNRSIDVRTRELLPSFLPKSIKEIATVAAFKIDKNVKLDTVNINEQIKGKQKKLKEPYVSYLIKNT